MAALATFVLVFVILQTTYGDDEHTNLCRLFKDNTRLRKPGSCTEYIACAGGRGEIYSCNVPKLFDATKQDCIESASAAEPCNNPCAGLTEKWVADPTSCNGFLYCSNSVAFESYCPDKYHFDASAQMCIHTTDSNCLSVANICALVPDKTTFRDEKDCSSYYQCLKGVHTRKECGKNTYYQVDTGSCVNKSHVACTAHPIPKNLCTDKTNPSPGFKADQATCRGYFNCKNLGIVPDLEPNWYQCPEGKFFSDETKKCMDAVDVVCDYNRCDGRGTTLVTSGSNDCHNYIVCENSMEVEEIECPRDTFFDENYQACVPFVVEYKCCDGRY